MLKIIPQIRKYINSKTIFRVCQNSYIQHKFELISLESTFRLFLKNLDFFTPIYFTPQFLVYKHFGVKNLCKKICSLKYCRFFHLIGSVKKY